MLIDKTHVRWGLTSAGILVFATAGYVLYALNSDSQPSGGTIVGLMFGIVASAMMIFAGLLAVRNRFPTVRCGSAKFWLRGHLWLGALSFIFALFHAGFRFGSTLETALMIAFIVIIGSGLYGLAMQQVLPRLLTSRVPLETFGQQVPFLCQRMQAESDMIVAERCGQLDCDHEEISDAAYNLAVSLGKLRNGKEGADFEKFLNETYTVSTSRKLPTSAIQTSQVETPLATAPAGEKPDKPAPANEAKPTPKSTPQPAGDDQPTAQDAPDRPMSKVEMMRAAAAKKKDAQQNPAKEEEAADPAKPADSASLEQPVKQSVEHKTKPEPTPPAGAEPAAATMTTEVYSVACPKCGKVLVLPDRSFLGRLGRCPQCEQRFVLGGEEDSPALQPAAAPAETSPAETSPAKTSPAKPLSKIEQMRAAAANKREQAADDDKPLSKVEQMRAAAAEKRKQQENGADEEKPLSKIEQMRAAAKKREQPESGEKPLSKVEQMRAAAAEKRQQTGDNDKPLSKVEQMRAAAAEKRKQAEPSDKPLSKIEQMRAAAAAKKESAGGGKPEQAKAAAPKTPPRPKAKKTAPVSEEPIPRAEILKSFYLTSVRPYLSSERKTAASLKAAVSPQAFAQTRSNLPPQLHDTLNQLQKFCEERHQFIVQKRLHWLLHSWLLVHIPATIALFVLFVVHVVVALRVIPWNQ